MKTHLNLLAIFTLCLGLTGCLKSRIQLRDEARDSDDKESSKAVPTQVQDVQPQGQYVIDEIKGELTRLNGRVEELEHAKPDASTVSSQKDEVKKLEARVNELEQAQAKLIEAIQKVKAAGPVSTVESESVFAKAKKLYDASEYDEAIDSFNEYLNNAKAPKAEEATFLRGESYFKLKQYKKAIVDFSRFPEKFTRSKFMSVALLKIGNSFDALGMKDDAKGFYQELVEKFPKSAEAKKAKAKLK